MVPMMILAALAAAPAIPPGYVEVKRLDLTAPVNTKTPWVVQVLQPAGLKAEAGDKAAQVCFTGGYDHRTVCKSLAKDGDPFQTIASVGVEPLSATGPQALVVRAKFAGPSHVLTRTVVWTYGGHRADNFLQTAQFDIGDQGEEERFISGSLDGVYVEVEPAYTYADENRWSDHRFSISVYKLDPGHGGYLQVLQYISASRYPAEREDPHYVIDRELPTVRRLLTMIYPKGAPS